MADTARDKALTDWSEASDRIRSAADAERLKAFIADDLHALNASSWRDLAGEMDFLAEDASALFAEVAEFGEAAEKISDAARNCRLSETALGDQLQLAADLDATVWLEYADGMEAERDEASIRSSAASTFADAIENALSAIEAWSEADRSEKPDAMEAALECLQEVVEAEDELFLAFDGYEPNEEEED